MLQIIQKRIIRTIQFLKLRQKKKTFVCENNQILKQFNTYHAYKSQLKSFSKKKFDPFCRRNRIMFDCNGVEIETTVGQLNFLNGL